MNGYCFHVFNFGKLLHLEQHISLCKTYKIEQHTTYFTIYNFMKVVTLLCEYCSIYCSIVMCKGRMIWQGPQYP